MRKSTLFISAALTTFMLAVLFGVVTAYKNAVNATQVVAAQPPPTAMAEVVSEPVPIQVVNITPEEAAAIASKVIGRTDLYSVEAAQLDGVDTYLVTFSSGDLVYVGMDGQVLSISKIVVTVITQNRRGNNDEEGGSPAVVDNGGGGGGEDGDEESHSEEDHSEDSGESGEGDDD